MTAGERAVWAAVYAAEWVRLSGQDAPDYEDIEKADEAARQAYCAVLALRTLPVSTSDWSDDAREIINGGES